MKWLIMFIAIGLAIWLLHPSGKVPLRWNPSMMKALTADLHDREGKPAPPQTLQGAKRILVYFSASWCPPCRAFTPELVTYYKSHHGGQAFQLLFVSNDQSAADMNSYMQEEEMPWWGVGYHTALSKALSKAYQGAGIPDLVMLDNQGRVMADSFEGDTYIGPQSVLRALDSGR